MVIQKEANLTIVIYSHVGKVWKIADFGLTSAGTSKRAITTIYSRGTPGFRAPELLAVDATFNNKVDVWSLGCILFQLCTRRLLFQSDYAVSQFDQSTFQLEVEEGSIPEFAKEHLEGCLRDMLRRNPQSRPSVGSLKSLLESYCFIWDDQLVRTLDGARVSPSYPDWKALVSTTTPEPGHVLTVLLQWYLANGERDIVKELLNASVKKYKKNIVLFERLANLHEEEHDWNAAVEVRTQILAINPIDERQRSKIAAIQEEYEVLNSELLEATERGDLEKVMASLENGANVNTEGGVSGNALQAAAGNGYQEVLSLLLEKGANMNKIGGPYGTALQAAAANGHMEAVLLLLKNGANLNVEGGPYGDALQAAAWKGSKDVVSLLLENGCNVNARGGYYGTALQAAAWNDHRDVVLLLLEKGSAVNANSGHYGNALEAAAVNGHREVASLLLQRGADVNVEVGCYGNALQAAAWNGKVEVVSLLLESGANVNVTGGYFGSALQAAAAWTSGSGFSFVGEPSEYQRRWGTLWKCPSSRHSEETSEYSVAFVGAWGRADPERRAGLGAFLNKHWKREYATVWVI
jgi:ankyrin repeat protein